MKENIKQWLDEKYSVSLTLDNREEVIDLLSECFNDLAPQWVSVESIALYKGARWLCNLNGQSIVLELGYETPTYEENFKPFFYWHEPYNGMLDIEWAEVTSVYPLPPSEELNQ